MPRRQRYYGDPPPPAPAIARPAPGALVEVVKVEPLCGAKALAHALQLQTTRQFYRLYEANRDGADPIPVENIAGRGLSADRATLLAWWARKHRADGGVGSCRHDRFTRL